MVLLWGWGITLLRSRLWCWGLISLETSPVVPRVVTIIGPVVIVVVSTTIIAATVLIVAAILESPGLLIAV